MKKNLILSLASLMLLSSCGINSFGKEITSLDDFVTIYKDSDNDFNVVKANRVFSRSDKAPDADLTPSNLPNHNAEIYSGNDFIYEETTKYTGFTIQYDVDTYFLVEGDKNGIVSTDPDDINAYRLAARSIIDTDYQTVLSVYDYMKKFIGKTGTAEIDNTSYTNVSLTFADANTTIGYTLKYTYQNGNGSRTEERYITLDDVGNKKWGVTFYSERITDTIDGEEFYYVTEYQFSCVNDETLNKKTLAAKNNLSTFTFTAKGLTDGDVSLDGDVPLTKK